ncbi:uncharacterized protein [Asterias amurensis]|uniref:uncharacterized protein n=1 Tax=Asterias amurensis TaxID=7602 RepID=UPI003AB446A4
MPIFCVVGGCNRNQRDDSELGFYRFPKDNVIRRQWVKFVDLTRSDFTLSKYSRICKAHFLDDVFDDTCIMKKKLGIPVRMVLTPTAIPTEKNPSMAAVDTASSSSSSIPAKRIRRSNTWVRKRVDGGIQVDIKTADSDKSCQTSIERRVVKKRSKSVQVKIRNPIISRGVQWSRKRKDISIQCELISAPKLELRPISIAPDDQIKAHEDMNHGDCEMDSDTSDSDYCEYESDDDYHPLTGFAGSSDLSPHRLLFVQQRKDFCWWPEQNFNIKRLIIDHKKPNPSKWKKFHVRVFHERFHTYLKADKAVSHYNSTSDKYESEEESNKDGQVGRGAKRSSKTTNGDKRGKGIDDGEEGREGDNEEEEEENIETQESDERASLQEEDTSVVLVTDADMHNADVMDSSIDEERSPRTKRRCISFEDGQRILENQEKIISILETMEFKHPVDVEEEIRDILPSKCSTIQELLDFDEQLKGKEPLSKTAKATFKKRRELLKQYLVVKAAGEKEARPVLRKMLEAVASVPVLAMLSKCGQERKNGDAKTSLQGLTLYTIIIRASRANRERPIQQAELDSNLVNILKAYPKRKAVKLHPVLSVPEREDTSEEEA